MNATRRTLTLLGVVFVLIGLVGFAAPDLMGMHLTVAHNLVHLISGALALYFGVKGTVQSARTFATVFGVTYGLLGVIGLIAGTGPDRMLTVIPDQLMFGTADSVIHLILGAVFLVAGLAKTTIAAAPPLR